jgi:hypothetical protein
MLSGIGPRLAGVAALAIIALAIPHGAAAAERVELASHRAIYDLKLLESRGRRALVAVRGRIAFDFAGTACEGYTLQFRQVTELDNGEGGVVVSDLRSTTWEDGDAKSYRYRYENVLNERTIETVDGRAQREAAAVAISLTKPAAKRFEIDARVAFPAEHMRRIVAAARAGQSILELPIYDGAETGEKVYNTLTVIGRAVAPDQRPVDDAAAGQAALASLKRWPVTISYFDKSRGEGEQTPVYALTFELYENGISRALKLDYGDFVIAGHMTTLELRGEKPCP